MSSLSEHQKSPILLTTPVLEAVPEKKNIAAEMFKGFITSAGACAVGLLAVHVVKTVLTKKSSFRVNGTEAGMLAAFSMGGASYEGWKAARNNKKADELEKQQVEVIKQQGKIFTKQLEQEKLASSQVPSGQGRVYS